MQAPAVIDGLYVVTSAAIDSPVPFVQRYTLNVDGQWVGRAPRVAICREFDGQAYLVVYCTEDWESLGAISGIATIEAAKARIERSYPGFDPAWIENALSPAEAHEQYRADLEASACSFCHRTRLEISSMAGDDPRICNLCVDNFHELMHSTTWET